MIQSNHNGVLTFTSKPLTVPFKELFTVHVGCVAKKKVVEPNGWLCVSSKTPEGVFATYSETTEWIRKPNGQEFALFVLVKTRSEKPFFATSKPYPCDGAVMGLVATEKAKNRFKTKLEALQFLNNQPWDEIGFRNADGRFQVTQRALTEVWLVDRMVELT